MATDIPSISAATDTGALPIFYDVHVLQCASRQMRRFVIDRKLDLTNISGLGIILYGIEWYQGGPCDVYWLRTQTTGQYPSMDVVKSTHCYNGNAEVIYLD